MAHHSHGETQTSLADLLLDYLNELSDEELKEFKWKLNRTNYKGLKPLPRGQVKDLNRTDLADKMISSYCEADALNVMLIILKNMNLNDLAQRLNEELKTVVPNQRAVMFVDQHRKAIIQRVTVIDPILDNLYKHIEGEKYNNIRAASTSQERMRRLYEVLNTDRLKELFFDALKSNESYLVVELLGL